MSAGGWPAEAVRRIAKSAGRSDRESAALLGVADEIDARMERPPVYGRMLRIDPQELQAAIELIRTGKHEDATELLKLLIRVGPEKVADAGDGSGTT